MVLADEVGYYRLIDRIAGDPDAEPLLREIGHRFAACFVTPYLHANDLRGVLDELAGLLAIHHRARLAVDFIDQGDARMTLRTLNRAEPAPTPFDLAVVEAALHARFRDVDIEPVKLGVSEGTDGARTTFDVHVR